MKKSKKLAKISTAVIGIYLLFLVVIGVKPLSYAMIFLKSA